MEVLKMKKSSFAAMILGTVSGILFALGMCMTLIKEWDTFTSGVILGLIGLVMGFITFLIWRKMENKKPIKVSGKTFVTTLIGIVGALALGVGMCFSMVWQNMILGVIIGIVGILILLSLIPIILKIRFYG